MSGLIRQILKNYKSGIKNKESDLELSINYFTEAIQLFIGNFDTLKEKNIDFIEEIYIELAEIFYTMRDYEKVTELCTQALNYFRNSFRILLIIAYSHYNIGEFGTSQYYIELIRDLQLNSYQKYKVHLLQGPNQALLNDYQAAIRSLLIAYKLKASEGLGIAIKNLHQLIQSEKKPGLSVCIICRDSERYIQKCLDSVKSFADEIIIVDTGSKDKTVDICSFYTSKVYQAEWQDDFSAARNIALEKANKDWILIIDSDQEFNNFSINELKLLIQDPLRIGYYLTIVINKEDYIKQLRLFRNRMGIKYQGIIHEQVHHSVGEALKKYPEFSVGNSAIRIYDKGYDNEENIAKKSQRNTKLYKKALKQLDLNIMDKIYYMVKLVEEKSGDGENYLNEAYSMIQSLDNNQLKSYPFIEKIYTILIEKCIQNSKNNEALFLAGECLKIFPNSIEALYYKAFLLEKSGNYHESHNIYKRIIKLLPRIDRYNFNAVSVNKLKSNIEKGLLTTQKYL